MGRRWPRDNRRVAVPPAQAADLHQPKSAGGDLTRILCLKTTRCLRRAWMVAHHGHRYPVRTTVRATPVMVAQRVDGTMRITHHDRPLAYHAIPARPESVAEPPKAHVPRRPVTPTRAHPWRKRRRSIHDTPAAAAISYTGPVYCGLTFP